MRGLLGFLIFALVLFLAGWVRWGLINYPVLSSDPSRDYLVARHIIKYKEFPLAGPWNGKLGAVKNSPFYYYFWAIPVAIKDDLVFLVGMNAVLQIVAVAMVYFLGKELFGHRVGVLAMLVYGFNQTAIWQANHPLMSNTMVPIFLTGLVWLLRAIRTRRLVNVALGLVVIVISGAVHNSVIVLWPAVFLFALMKMRSWRLTIVAWLMVGAWVGLVALVLFAPTIIYLEQAGVIKNLSNIGNASSREIFNTIDQVGVESWDEFWFSVLAGVKVFWRGLTFPLEIYKQIQISLFLVLSLGLTLLYKNWKEIIKNNLFLLVLVILPILVLALFGGEQIYDYYFASIYGIAIIIFASWCAYWLNLKNKKASAVAFIFLLLVGGKFFTNNGRIFNKPELSFDPSGEVGELVRILRRFDDPIPRIIVYENDLQVYEAIVLAPLEKQLNKRITLLSDSSAHSFLQETESEDYIVVTNKILSRANMWDVGVELVKSQGEFAMEEKIFDGAVFRSYYLRANK